MSAAKVIPLNRPPDLPPGFPTTHAEARVVQEQLAQLIEGMGTLKERSEAQGRQIEEMVRIQKSQSEDLSTWRGFRKTAYWVLGSMASLLALAFGPEVGKALMKHWGME